MRETKLTSARPAARAPAAHRVSPAASPPEMARLPSPCILLPLQRATPTFSLPYGIHLLRYFVSRAFICLVRPLVIGLSGSFRPRRFFVRNMLEWECAP